MAGERKRGELEEAGGAAVSNDEQNDEQSDEQNDEQSDEAGDIQPMSFDIFVLSLNASALIHLGDAADAQGSTAANLPLAQQTIDILAMLEEKTRGNLSGAEERLLNQILFDLRMRYARKAGR